MAVLLFFSEQLFPATRRWQFRKALLYFEFVRFSGAVFTNLSSPVDIGGRIFAARLRNVFGSPVGTWRPSEPLLHEAM
jgi:hypothetical protein